MVASQSQLVTYQFDEYIAIDRWRRVRRMTRLARLAYDNTEASLAACVQMMGCFPNAFNDQTFDEAYCQWYLLTSDISFKKLV